VVSDFSPASQALSSAACSRLHSRRLYPVSPLLQNPAGRPGLSMVPEDYLPGEAHAVAAVGVVAVVGRELVRRDLL